MSLSPSGTAPFGAPHDAAARRAWLLRQCAWLGLGAVLLLALFETSTLDMRLEGAFYDAATRSFPLERHWFFDRVLHRGLKTGAYVLALLSLVLCVQGWRGKLAFLPRRQAVLAALGLVLIPLLTSSLKQLTNRHCPWDVIDFGGYAPHIGLFAQTAADLKRGICFPAGHASAGYMWVIWCPALLATRPLWARAWWVFGMLAGLILGMGRMAQGAHFASHVLWSGWLAWLICVLLVAVLRTPVQASAPAADSKN